MNISIPNELLTSIDAVVSKGSYSSRSEFIRDALREFLEQLQVGGDITGEVLGSITIAYYLRRRGISDEINKLQTHYEDVIVTSVHELSRDLMIELILTKGDSSRVKALTDNLRAVRGMGSVRTNIVRAPDGKL